jgi:hypothetical protein
MSRRLRSFSALFVLLPALPLGATAQGEAVSREALEAHVRFLASDLLEGRMTGERGYDLAALYAESRFRALGLEPAGEEGTYRQTVPFRRYQIVRETVEASVEHDGERVPLAWKDDFVTGGSAVSEEVAVAAPLVVAGYGMVAPELGIDDYAGVEAAGRVVVLLRGAPKSLPSEQRAHYSSSRTKLAEAERQGAAGVLFFRDREELERRPWERIVRHAGRAGLEWLDEAGVPQDVFPGLQVVATLGPAGLEKLLAGTPVEAEALLDRIAAGEAPSFDVPGTFRYAARTTHEPTRADNVVALLPGSDPERADEIVLFTAHLDHVGRHETPGEEDPIYNGAYDNAMGSSILLEAARAMSRRPEAPARPVAFLLVTGEERGLLGSDYFARFPTLDGTVVANVNLDMPLFLFPVRQVIAFGAGHSNLGDVVDEVAATSGFEVVPDPFPEEVIFVRSDQYSFVRQGIPAVYLVPGLGSTDPEIDGAEVVAAFRKERYHEPSDDLTVPIDWESVVAFTRLNVALGLAIADGAEVPAWNEGDFFGEMFGGRQSPGGSDGPGGSR